ncbi:phenylacetate--CoA ligase family protein [Bacillus mycoides]|uniref:phenylacetate--CoA ligase family protein n=1 Tax=Bacillus mycoides TaxID=1405 RepID=UPI001F17009F|nr:phenylacetate--CoA ligase family protein [Bacillus mycoides]
MKKVKKVRTILQKLSPEFKEQLKHVASWTVPKILRESKEYKSYKKFLDGSEGWDVTKIEDFQNMQLRMLISHAYKNVQYYTELFDNFGITPDNIKDTRDLKKIPFTSKEIVKENKNKFLARNFNEKNLNQTYTGGTTSAPLHFYNDSVTNEREKAFYNRIWKKYGYQGQKCLFLRGEFEGSNDLFSYDRYRNLVKINTRNLNDHKMEEIIKKIIDYKIQFIQAYPSLIYLLSQYILKNGLSEKVNGQIKAVFCSSERMFEFQRECINKAFNCPVVDYYGHNERLVLMEWCSECNVYHVIPEYGITEFIKPKVNGIEEDIAEIVGTGFNNYAFPLIRYKTSDFVSLSKDECICKYNRKNQSVRSIDGRSGDFLITSDGKYYSPTVLEFANTYIDNFKDLQLVQNSIGKLDVLIIPNENYNSKQGELFQQELINRIDAKIQVNIELVDYIDRPVNQKKRFVISNIDKR